MSKKRVPGRAVGSPMVPRRKRLTLFEELNASGVSMVGEKMVTRNKVSHIDGSSIKQRFVSHG